MTDPAGLWTRFWRAFSKRLARALSPAVASGLSASEAIVRPGLLVAMLIALAPVYVVLTQSGLHASGNTITVNNTTDPATTSGNGFCTLREAIDNANAKSDTTSGDCAAGTGTDTINFSVSGTITLGSGLPAIVNTLTIDGTGQTVTVSTISSGNVADDGGGIYSDVDSNLTISNSTISNSLASEGGGIYNNQGTLTVTNSTISGNTASGSGGGVFESGGTITVTGSTFSSNTADTSGEAGSGAGLYNSEGTLSVAGSTFSENALAEFGT